MATQKLADPDVNVAGTQDEDFFAIPAVEKAPYNPEMDPGAQAWNPRKYFAAQPKVIVTIHRNEQDMFNDPKGEKKVFQTLTINGYKQVVEKGVATRLPKDFAALVTPSMGHTESQIAEAREG